MLPLSQTLTTLPPPSSELFLMSTPLGDGRLAHRAPDAQHDCSRSGPGVFRHADAFPSLHDWSRGLG